MASPEVYMFSGQLDGPQLNGPGAGQFRCISDLPSRALRRSKGTTVHDGFPLEQAIYRGQPTRMYTTGLHGLRVPKSAATKSNFAAPTSPQFNPPMTKGYGGKIKRFHQTTPKGFCCPTHV